MSRRAPAEDRAEKNRNTLKQLVKLESNKSCADCKKNKHPRWASWNLGVFMCIRCSGIHRGMGTHISRVKSVDLDTWTDEQLQSMLRWGNTRANKYWEAKLAPGHVPSESKIENFIRTKYESKRWVMEGPMPDPSTLDAEGDDDVPLNVVQEKAKMERSASGKLASPPGPSNVTRATPRNAPAIDLFGDDPPTRSSSGPPMSKPAPKADAAPPKATKPADSLLGLDFFGGPATAPPPRPSSTTATPGAAPSRPDLKQSILSLYASKPAPPPQPQQSHHQSQGSFGGFQSPTAQSPPAQQSAFGGMNDAFSSMNFSSPAPQQAATPSPFANIGMPSQKSNPTTNTSFGGGGSFFDTTPAAPPPQAQSTQPPAPSRGFSSNSGFGDFFSSTSPTATAPPPVASKSQSNNLFDLMGDAPVSSPVAAKPTPVAVAAAPSYNNSAFNLSKPAAPSQSAAQQPSQPATLANMGNNFDAWGSTEAWGDSSTSTARATTATNTTSSSSQFDGGWGGSASGGFGGTKVTSPKVSADEDFGGWASSAPAPAKPAAPSGNSSAQKPFAGSDDPFENVWG
ncbi:ArfGap-domain-containing protein [Tothia fuscella]|uniref:ArfGap-domain-containing protein n=1 Tax=Tothia fuscella TaxID=1048955 RepID=A0A9P4U2N3_9PEZI|nr:ArfGap-domain-containing protein [Tothia fuscella]